MTRCSKILIPAMLATALLNQSPSAQLLADDPPATTKPAFTLSKETTRITAPLLPDGRPDYVTYLNQIQSKDVTPENNALVLILQVTGTGAESISPKIHDEALKRLGITSEPTPSLQNYWAYLKTKNLDWQSEEVQNQAQDGYSKPWTAEEYPNIAQWLMDNKTGLDQIVLAAQRPRYFWPLISSSDHLPMIMSNLPNLGQIKQSTEALTTRAMLHLGNRELKECQSDLLAAHRLSRLLTQGSTLIEKLVGIAMETMAAKGDAELAKSLPAKEAKTYLAQLQQLPAMVNITQSIDITERLSTLDAILCVGKYGLNEISTIKSLSGDNTPLPEPLVLNLTKVDWDQILKQENQWYDRMVEAMNKTTFAERQPAIAELDQAENIRNAPASNTNDPTEQMSHLLLKLLTPSLGKAREMFDRAQQHTDLGMLAVALAAYHGEHSAYPDKLEDLAPTYLKQIPLDIFANAPLSYLKVDSGYLLYSIGPNQQDDHGTQEKNESTGDIVIQVP